jgi:signal transduction histidine kinase
MQGQSGAEDDAIPNSVPLLRAMVDRLLAERVDLQQRLESAEQQLAYTRRLEHDFVALVNHELRTPFSTILGSLEVLGEQGPGPLNQRQLFFIENIEEAAQQLLYLINNLLDYNLLQAGRLTLEWDAVPLALVCRRAAEQVSDEAARKYQQIELRCDQRNLIISADLRRLQQMIAHLLRNAIAFTPPGGALGLDVVLPVSLSSEIRFEVWDTGPGIAPSDLPLLFVPFTPLDQSLSRSHRGLGLGLAIVQRLADLHGGRVEVASTEGQGSRFTICLPYLPPDP